MLGLHAVATVNEIDAVDVNIVNTPRSYYPRRKSAALYSDCNRKRKREQGKDSKRERAGEIAREGAQKRGATSNMAGACYTVAATRCPTTKEYSARWH